MKKKTPLCSICREKIPLGRICDECKKKAKQEAIDVRKNIERALENEK